MVRKTCLVSTDGDIVLIILEGKTYGIAPLDSFEKDHPKLFKALMKKRK